MIAAYSPAARGRSERMFRTHQERLPKELVLAAITDNAAANRYVREVYMPAFNAEFTQLAAEEGTAFVPCIGGQLTDILCERYERVVGHDNCVSFEGLMLQIPADRHRVTMLLYSSTFKSYGKPAGIKIYCMLNAFKIPSMVFFCYP